MAIDMNKFDGWLWRINGLIIFCAALAGFFLILLAGYQIFKDIRGDRVKADVVNINKETNEEEILSLGYFSMVEGTNYLKSPLHARGKARSFSSSSRSIIRNYLFYNQDSGKNHWLLGDHNKLIPETYSLTNRKEEKKNKIIGFVYEIVHKDSNNDGVMDEKDLKSIVMSNYKGEEVKEILKDVEDVIGFTQTRDDEFILFIRQAGLSKALNINISNAKIRLETLLPIGKTGS